MILPGHDLPSTRQAVDPHDEYNPDGRAGRGPGGEPPRAIPAAPQNPAPPQPNGGTAQPHGGTSQPDGGTAEPDDGRDDRSNHRGQLRVAGGGSGLRDDGLDDTSDHLTNHRHDDRADERLARRIEDIPASEGAAVLIDLPPERAAAVAEALDPNTAADILSEMNPSDAAAVMADMETPEASVVLSAMDPDDRVDVLNRLEPRLQQELVSDLPAEDAAEVRLLSSYPPDTAGGLMTTDVTALHEGLTVQQAIDELRRLRERHEQMFYSYVVDDRRHLVGVLSMRDLILAAPSRQCRDIMIQNVRALRADTDQEEVARLFKQLNYLAMPVVDERHRLLGIVTVDDVVDVIERESTEDFQKFFGAGAEERLASPWQFSFRSRTGWLVVNLATAFLAGLVVSAFDEMIAKITVLAVYMPIVAGMGGNASAQAMAVAIRGIAVNESGRSIVLRVLRREGIVGLLTGVVIGAITASVAVAWQRDWELGLVVAAALIINHTLACTTGAGIPFLMKRLGYDPAQSATIFATTVTDVVGFFSLLGLAYLFLHR